MLLYQYQPWESGIFVITVSAEKIYIVHAF